MKYATSTKRFEGFEPKFEHTMAFQLAALIPDVSNT